MVEPLPALGVGLLGLGSCACGFIADATRTKRDDIIMQGGECVYPRSPAFTLGFVAGVLLLLAVALITGLCCCKCRQCVSTPHLTVGILSVVMAWFTASRAELLFLIATAGSRSGSHGQAPECYDSLHLGDLFAPAAYHAFIVTFFGLLSGHALLKGTKLPAAS